MYKEVYCSFICDGEKLKTNYQPENVESIMVHS